MIKNIKFTRNIFLIGLGGSGKSTVGKLLAKKLSYKFIDLDDEFRAAHGDIGKYVDSFGSKSYGINNSKLLNISLDKNKQEALFVLPPGFLVSKKGIETKKTEKHLKLVSKNGITVLLLPSLNFGKCLEVLIKRQLQRGFGYTEEEIIKDVTVRFPKYKKLGDIRIFSTDRPSKIANQIIDELILI